MSEGATTSAPARAWDSAAFASSGSVASLSTSSPRSTPQWPCDVYSSRQTSVMTATEGAERFRMRSGLLHGGAVVPGLAAGLVLALRNSEQDDGGDAQRRQALRLGQRLVGRQAVHARQRRDRLAQALAVTHEERRHELFGRESRLAHQAAQGRCAAQAAHARGRKGRHGVCSLLAGRTRGKRLEPPRGRRKARLGRDLDARHATGVQPAQSRHAEHDRGGRAQPLLRGGVQSLEEPLRRRRGRRAEGGERLFQDLPAPGTRRPDSGSSGRARSG